LRLRQRLKYRMRLRVLTWPANKAQTLITNMMLNTAEPTTAPTPISS